MGSTARTTWFASSPAEPWIVCLARSASASISAFAWLTLAPAAFRAASRAVSRSAFRCLALCSRILNIFGPRVANLIGILCRLGFRLRDCLMSVLDGAFGPGAALGKCPSQRTLHQNLVGRHQHHKEQNRRDGAEQKRTDLLNDFIHVCIRLTQADGYFHRGFRIFLIVHRDQIWLSWGDRQEATTLQIFGYTTDSGKCSGTPFCIREKPPRSTPLGAM